MLSVGILADNPVWEEYLTAFSQDAPFRITGSFQHWQPEYPGGIENLSEADVIWIPQKTNESIGAAIQSLRESRHVLLGFPVVDFQREASHMVQLAREAHVEVQVGHHDRYHPAFRSVQDILVKPQYIRLNHQTQITESNNAEQLFMENLLHDVDAILALISEPIKKVQAHLSHTSVPFGRVLNVRLEFHNATVATICLSNLDLGSERQLEIIGQDCLYTIDLMRGTSQVRQFGSDNPPITKLWPVNGLLGINSGLVDKETLTRECVSFFYQKHNKLKTLASIEEGYEALQITNTIYQKIGMALV